MPRFRVALPLVCAACGIAGAGLVSMPPRAAPGIASGGAEEIGRRIVADLAQRRLILVCADPAVHADLTYRRALMPRSFPDAVRDAVRSDTCRPRPSHPGDFGEVMRR